MKNISYAYIMNFTKIETSSHFLLRFNMFNLPLIKGFLVSSGLIVAIGAQNAFVLRQGMSKHYVFVTAFVCALIDFILVCMGVFGLGAMISTNSMWMTAIKWVGFCFLFVYGCLSLNELKTNKALYAHNNGNTQKKSLSIVIISLLAVSLLNPHVYLDTMLLIGSIGCQYNDLFDKHLFIVGSGIASTIWFFSLCFGASYFSEFLKKPIVWKFVHIIIASIMFWMAITLLL